MAEALSSKWLIVGATAAVGLVAGFLATWYLIVDPVPPPPREEIILSRSDLRSNLPGQPFPQHRREIIEGKRGHTAGHVVSSQSTALPPGEYIVTMELEVFEPRDSVRPSCIMDLLADDRMIGNVPVQSGDGKAQLRFRSPAANGSSNFVTRLFCDGRETVRVFQIAFVRNPDTPPGVIHQ